MWGCKTCQVKLESAQFCFLIYLNRNMSFFYLISFSTHCSIEAALYTSCKNICDHIQPQLYSAVDPSFWMSSQCRNSHISVQGVHLSGNVLVQNCFWMSENIQIVKHSFSWTAKEKRHRLKERWKEKLVKTTAVTWVRASQLQMFVKYSTKSALDALSNEMLSSCYTEAILCVSTYI